MYNFISFVSIPTYVFHPGVLPMLNNASDMKELVVKTKEARSVLSLLWVQYESEAHSSLN